MRSLGNRWSPSSWSVRTRVTVTATLIVALLLVAGSLIFYQVVRYTVLEGLHDQGTHAITDLTTLVRTSDPRGQLSARDTEFTLLQVVSEDDVVLATSASLEDYGPLDVPVPRNPGRAVYRTLKIPGKGQVYLVTERVRTAGGWRIAHAATPIDEFNRYQGIFIGMLVGMSVVGTAAVGYIVSLSVRRALRPVRTMSGELAEITGRAPDRRVTVPGPADEVSELARSVNVTLGRLQDVLERQRGFVADVSHELRSPLTGLRAQLELALEHPEDEDWPVVARTALDNAERLHGIVSDLLILAKVGAGVEAGREPVDLASLVRSETARRTRRVPVELDVEEGVTVLATPHHIVRVLTNLLDNAERHAESWIRVTVTAEERDAVLEVLDDGAGIAPKDRERIFWRFHRLAESRDRDQAGTGLGLTISRDIARAHGGSLVAAESDRGARFVMRLPLDRSAAGGP